MRIAFILPVFPELSQTFVLNQITGLIDRGHDVKIFSRNTSSTAKVHDEVVKYELQKKTCYYRENYLSLKKNKSKAKFYLNGIAQILKCFLVRPKPTILACLHLVMNRKEFSLGLLYYLMPFFYYGKFDIIYCHFGDMGRFGLWIKKLDILKGKLVTVFHGYDMSTYMKQHDIDIYADLFKGGDLFLPISLFWKNKLIKLGCPEKKMLVHRMGIDLNRFKYIRRPTSQDNIVMLSVARLVDKKGIEFAIKATAIVKNEIPKIKYFIAGEGPLKNSLNSLIDQYNLNDEIELVGWKSQKEISRLMTKADLLLVPSVIGKDGDMEGLPVVILEACAQGFPVVSSFHSGIPEIIEDGVTGALCREGDVNQIASKLRWMIMSPKKRHEMAVEAYKRVVEEFNIEQLNDDLERLFLDIL